MTSTRMTSIAQTAQARPGLAAGHGWLDSLAAPIGTAAKFRGVNRSGTALTGNVHPCGRDAAPGDER